MLCPLSWLKEKSGDDSGGHEVEKTQLLGDRRLQAPWRTVSCKVRGRITV